MMSFRGSPLCYLGNRRDEAQRLLQILGQGKKFQVFYDPFCGSGSFTQAAAQLQVAQRYVMSDSYLPLVGLLQAMILRPYQVSHCYESHYQQLQQLHDKAQQEAYYNQVKNTFNCSEKFDDFLFLNNLAQYHLPVIDQETYCSELSCESMNEGLSPIFINKQIYAFSSLLRPATTIKSDPFDKVLEEVTSQDLVILDPPYPDLPNDMPIYHKLNSQEALHEQLLDTLQQLQQKNVAFILFYGTWGMDARYMLENQVKNLQHLVSLSASHNNLFSEYLEHCYLSENLALSEQVLAQLPLVLFETIKHKSSSEAIAHIRLQNANRSSLVSADTLNGGYSEKTGGKSGTFIWVAGQEVSVSPREVDVLRLLKQGLSAKETAATLSLSVRTVESYLDNIRNKTGCRTKLQLLSQLHFN